MRRLFSGRGFRGRPRRLGRGRPGLLRRQLGVFGDELKMHRPTPRLKPLVIHRHESLEMLEQPVFVLEHRRSRLAREYRRLARLLMMENVVDPHGAMFFLQSLEQDRELLRSWPWSQLYQ